MAKSNNSPQGWTPPGRSTWRSGAMESEHSRGDAWTPGPVGQWGLETKGHKKCGALPRHTHCLLNRRRKWAEGTRMGQDSAQSFLGCMLGPTGAAHLAPGTSCLLTTHPWAWLPMTGLTGSHFGHVLSQSVCCTPTRAESASPPSTQPTDHAWLPAQLPCPHRGRGARTDARVQMAVVCLACCF